MAQVRIRLSTKTEDVLPEDPGPILVSTDLRRFQLSTLVNRLLSTAAPVPFDFLINGQLLRTSIDDFLTQNGLSAETVLTVEYLRALVPPAHVASLQHDDWVSAVDLSSHGILSASYDGLLRTWDASGRCIATSASATQGGHTGAIKSAKWLGDNQVVSTGLDRIVRVWSYKPGADPSQDGTFTPTLELYGHTASVDRLAVSSDSSRVLSASADHTLRIWAPAKSAPAAPEGLIPGPATKRRKLSAPGSSVSLPQRGSLSTLSGHTAQVADIIFKPSDSTVAYSASWDHTLRTWDLATSSCVQTRTTAQSLLSVAAMPALNLVAAGTSARHVTLIDPRASSAEVVAMTLRGHNNAVVSLAPSPKDPHVLASGSHDGTVRVWDVRSVSSRDASGPVGQAMFVLEREGKEKMPVGGEGVKVFGIAWDEAIGLVSAGEDKRVQINREA